MIENLHSGRKVTKISERFVEHGENRPMCSITIFTNIELQRYLTIIPAYFLFTSLARLKDQNFLFSILKYGSLISKKELENTTLGHNQ